MSAWWKLAKAAPVLLRHFLAYAELAEQDLEVYSRRLMAQCAVFAVALIAGFFTLALSCVAVVAATWDTPNRMPAIYGMLGGCALVALIAVVVAFQRAARAPALFESVRREWGEDRVILDRLLAEEDHGKRD